MLTVSPTAMVRSSLEEMLDSLRRRDEEDKPRDLPPALPSRPTSRARLRPARRSLPVNFEVAAAGTAATSPVNSLNQSSKEKEGKGPRAGSFGSKKDKDLDGESPYVMGAEEKECEQRTEETDRVNLAAEPSGSLPRFRESNWDENIGYFIKKVKPLIRLCSFGRL